CAVAEVTRVVIIAAGPSLPVRRRAGSSLSARSRRTSGTVRASIVTATRDIPFTSLTTPMEGARDGGNDGTDGDAAVGSRDGRRGGHGRRLGRGRAPGRGGAAAARRARGRGRRAAALLLPGRRSHGARAAHAAARRGR